jgi:hypothetical protein
VVGQRKNEKKEETRLTVSPPQEYLFYLTRQLLFLSPGKTNGSDEDSFVLNLSRRELARPSVYFRSLADSGTWE